jgi:pimeloyl-ACP methyl ester carboxylesterase
MATGVLLGIGIAGRRERPRPTARRRPVGTAIIAAATIGLALLVAWPASTPAVSGADGGPAPDGIAELATVRLGGTDQAVMIRGASADKPVLLYLSGGPGQSDLALARVLSAPWTSDFVFVDLDQRGNGKSYAAIDPLSEMTVDRAVSDVIELTDYLRERFGQAKIYLMGESWGSILGVLAVQRRPDLYHAWIGSGQMVDVGDTDRRIYVDLMVYATTAGDDDLLARLAAIGEPPYRDIPWANSNLLAWYEYLYKPYTPSEGYRARGSASGLDPFGILGSEYTFIEKRNVLRGLIDTFTVMYPQLDAIDFRTSAARLEVPVYILDGMAELEGRRALMLEWFELLDAPSKQLVSFDGAAHSVAFEQADEVLRLLNDTIVPATGGGT